MNVENRSPDGGACAGHVDKPSDKQASEELHRVREERGVEGPRGEEQTERKIGQQRNAGRNQFWAELAKEALPGLSG